MEGAIEPIGLALDHVARRRGLELLVDHHDDDAAVIETSSTRSSGHLDICAESITTSTYHEAAATRTFARGQVAEVLAVKFADLCEELGTRRQVSADPTHIGEDDGLGGPLRIP